MSHYPEMEDDEEELEQRRARRPRRSGPRFGPLLTIAVAILTLFGAASRLGKPQAGDGLFALDQSASNRLEQERIRSEEERLRTIVTLGAVPTTAESLRPSGFAARLDLNPVPPSRGDFDLDAYTREQLPPAPPAGGAPAAPGMSLSIPFAGEGGGAVADNYDRGARFDPAPEASPDSARHPKTYTVQSGDNWVKVAQKTGKKWQDLQKANPASSGGLRVGMKLVIP